MTEAEAKKMFEDGVITKSEYEARISKDPLLIGVNDALSASDFAYFQAKQHEYLCCFYHETTGLYPIYGASQKIILLALKIYMSQNLCLDYSDFDSVDREKTRSIIELLCE